MPTDRELLEGAARATDIDGDHHVTPNGTWVFIEPRKPNWNPLTDDGDALRLAVNLAISIDKAKTDYFASGGDFSDPYAFTRRAIVRAAYEIGKAT